MESTDTRESAGIESLLDVQDGVNAGISGNGDYGAVHALTVEVLGGAFGGGEVKSRHPPGKDSVHFLRERFMWIARTEPRFDMADGDFGVKRCQGAAEGGGSVALDEDDTGLFFREDRFEGSDDTRRGLGKGLTGAHDVEVSVWDDLERRENLVEHFTVLRGDADPDVEIIRTGLHVPNYRTQFNSLGPSTEDEEDLSHL